MRFRFGTLQVFGKTSREIERLQSAEIGFPNLLIPSFQNSLESLSARAALELSIFVIIFKNFSSEVLFKQKSSEIIKLE